MPDRHAAAPAGRIAVVDIGSNSLRLVVFERLGAGLLPLLNEKVMCALGRGIARTGRLKPEGVELAFANLQRFVALANILLGGLAVGIARAALDYSADYAKGRIQFGRPISSYQSIAFMAAEMAMDLDASRLLIWRAAQTWDLGQDALRLAERARLQAAKTAQKVTIDAVQILGGAGFLQDYPVEIWMRDAAALAALG